MNGIITLNDWSGLFHQDCTPLGIRDTIDAKIISDMPLPIPRWVISSPIHMTSIVPAVRVIAIRKTLPMLKFGIRLTPACVSRLLNRKT